MTDLDDRPAGRSSVAGHVGKQAARHVGRKIALVLFAKVGFWVALLVLILLVVIAAVASVHRAPAAAASPDGCVTGTAPTLTAEQNNNAHAIASVALGLRLGEKGVLVGIVTALTESTLTNVNFGDVMSNGLMSTSRGLFQQLAAWITPGTTPDPRLDPKRAALMFYTGGAAGQPGLADIPGWAQMPAPQAAQAVEGSQFADGSNYTRNLPHATTITAALLGGQSEPVSSCSAAGAAVPVDVLTRGITVTIPGNPNVTPAVRGQRITAPTAGMARGLAAGLGQLGRPYVWGGTNDDGCARGGGALNSCQGQGPGWDCSGLTEYVITQAGNPDPGGDSGTQRNPAHAVPWARGRPGDLVGFPGHVAVFLGVTAGVTYILEASTVGVPVHVVPLTRTDHDPTLYRYWS